LTPPPAPSNAPSAPRSRRPRVRGRCHAATVADDLLGQASSSRRARRLPAWRSSKPCSRRLSGRHRRTARARWPLPEGRPPAVARGPVRALRANGPPELRSATSASAALARAFVDAVAGTGASWTRARPRRGCAAWRNTPYARAADRITASASTTVS
jgi:hypothetical protein